MIKKIKNSLTIKISLVTSLLLTLCCVLTYGFISQFMPQTYSANLNTIIKENAQNLVADLKKTTLDSSADLFDMFLFNNKVVIQLQDSSGAIIPIPTNTNFIVASSIMLSDENGEIIDIIPETNKTISTSYVSAEQSYFFSFLNASEQFKLTIWSDGQAVNQVKEAMVNILPWLILAILAMSVIAALVFSRFVTRPVIKISSISQRMSMLDFSWHCDENRNDELGILAQNLNNLSNRLSVALFELQDANVKLQNDLDKEKKMEQARLEFFSAVSHELKTPITIIKGQLEGMLLCVGAYKDREKYLARSLEITIGLENIVQEILTISRMETSGFELHNDEFDFSDMVRKQLSSFEDLLITKQLQLQTDIEDNLILKGDKVLLQKVINNLVVNATIYSPAGNNILFKAWKDNEKCHFTIENTGVHIPEPDLLKLFEAFYRVEQSRSRQSGGSGLGLFIVQMILEQHKAVYKIENTEEGVQFSVSLN